MIDKNDVISRLIEMKLRLSNTSDIDTISDAIALISRYAPYKKYPNNPLNSDELSEALDQVEEISRTFNRKGWGKCWSLYEAAEYFKTQRDFLSGQNAKQRKLWK